MLHWIIDCEWYHVGNDIYPVEISLLRVEDTSICHTYYVYYPTNYYNNLTTQWQHNSHGLTWTEGDSRLCEVIWKMHQHVHGGDVIYVKGGEKSKLVSKWFPKVVEVVEITTAPAYGEISHSCLKETCSKHAHDTGLSCARRKAFKLLPYV